MDSNDKFTGRQVHSLLYGLSNNNNEIASMFRRIPMKSKLLMSLSFVLVVAIFLTGVSALGWHRKTPSKQDFKDKNVSSILYPRRVWNVHPFIDLDDRHKLPDGMKGTVDNLIEFNEKTLISAFKTLDSYCMHPSVYSEPVNLISLYDHKIVTLMNPAIVSLNGE
jgi:hypothetical protein